MLLYDIHDQTILERALGACMTIMMLCANVSWMRAQCNAGFYSGVGALQCSAVRLALSLMPLYAAVVIVPVWRDHMMTLSHRAVPSWILVRHTRSILHSGTAKPMYAGSEFGCDCMMTTCVQCDAGYFSTVINATSIATCQQVRLSLIL
jgi:hypothetical protein